MENTRTLKIMLVVLALFSITVSAASLAVINGLSSQVGVLQRTSFAASPVILSKSALATSGYVGQNSLPIVAVGSDGSGIVNQVNLKLLPGSSNVLVNTNPFIEPDLQYSDNTAVAYAQKYLGSGSNMDYLFNYASFSDTQLIGGGSAGAAETILAIATLQNKQLKTDAVITGTIQDDGSIGQIGGVFEKAQAVAAAGYKYFLVPAGQGETTTYTTKTIQQQTPFGFTVQRTVQVPTNVNLIDYAKKNWGLTVVEVSNVNDALPYFLN